MEPEYRNYVLMHRDVEVAELTLDGATGSIIAVNALLQVAHLPVGISVRHGQVDRAALNEWWVGRAIPASRAGLRHLLEELQITAPQKLLEKCLGLSLSDAYWICPKNRTLHWAEVNFHQNPFSEDVGNILFGGGVAETISLMSPDNTSDGWLRKKWTIQNGKRCLVKGGSGALQQEPYNEVIASRIMERLNIPHVPYTLQMADGLPYSVCEDFVAEDTEYVSAWYLMHTKTKPNHISLYQHYLERCSALGIPGAERAIAQQIVVDYLLLNEDRHQGNFGAVRRADTLEYTGVAPLFDTGSSLWFETPTPLIRAGTKVACKPFKTSHEEQLRLVSDFGWLDESKLEHLGDIAREVLADSDFIDDTRCEAIARALEKRALLLREHVQHKEKAADDVSRDVKRNIAFSRPER